MKISKLLLLGLCLVVPFTSACDDSDDDTNTNTTATTTGTGTDTGTTATGTDTTTTTTTATGTDTTTTTTTATGTDTTTTTTGTDTTVTDGECTDDDTETSCPEEDMYFECLLTTCDAQYRTCFGDSIDGGAIGGTCKDWLECNVACGCDVTCQQACVQSTECLNCITMGIGGCALTSGCTPATCDDTGTDTGTDTGGGEMCTELLACCDTLTDPTTKTLCQAGASSGDESTCGQVLTGLKAQMLCGG